MPTSSKTTSPSQNKIAAQNSPATVRGVAKVNFKVIVFRDVLAPGPPVKKGKYPGTCPPLNVRGTTYKMWMPKTLHPQVSIDPKDPDTLIVKAQGATLLFTITQEEYYPVGITFFLKNGDPTVSDQKRLGILNFAPPMIRPNKLEHSLQVTALNNEGKHKDWFKFSVIIQRACDGKIGIIDPGIIHEC
jgi:hypothetical protein